MTSTITAGLEKAAPGAYQVMAAADADAARTLIRDRSVYGAFVVGQDGMTVLTAPAASLPVSTLLAATGQQLGAARKVAVTVEEVVPFTAADPRGVGLSAGALPIALGGLMAGAAFALAVRGRRQRLAAASAFAVVAGLALTAVLHFGLGTFAGNYWLESLAAMLGIAASCFFVLGMSEALGFGGIALSAVLLVVLGNPLSGIASAPELLPTPWGALGQLLPPGATGTLLRNVAFFDGAAILPPVAVLVAWFGLGLVLYFAAAVARAQRAPAAA